MMINVKIFGRLKDQFDQAQLSVELDQPQATVADVWRLINHSNTLNDDILCAVNLEYARFADPVNHNDEVAFFPPVTGG